MHFLGAKNFLGENLMKKFLKKQLLNIKHVIEDMAVFKMSKRNLFKTGGITCVHEL